MTLRLKLLGYKGPVSAQHYGGGYPSMPREPEARAKELAKRFIQRPKGGTTQFQPALDRVELAGPQPLRPEEKSFAHTPMAEVETAIHELFGGHAFESALERNVGPQAAKGFRELGEGMPGMEQYKKLGKSEPVAYFSQLLSPEELEEIIYSLSRCTEPSGS